MAYLPLDIKYLTEEMMSIAKQELGETDEIRRKAIQEMRKKVKADVKLTCPTDDHYLLEYLRARKFNVKKAVALLQRYYNIKKSYRDVYGKADIDFLMNPIRERVVSILPKRDCDGSVIMLVELCHWNVDNINFESIVHSVTCTLLACAHEYPATQICGFKVIFDLRGIGIYHAKSMSLRLLGLSAMGFSNALPVRIKGLHCVCHSQILKFCWNTLKQFLSEKIRNRAFYHTSTDSLLEHFDQELLPEAYDGCLKYDDGYWEKTMDSFHDLYFEMMNYGYKSKKIS